MLTDDERAREYNLILDRADQRDSTIEAIDALDADHEALARAVRRLARERPECPCEAFDSAAIKPDCADCEDVRIEWAMKEDDHE